MDIPISKDLRKFKTKDIGNFSLKEAAWIALAVSSAVIVYKFVDKSLDSAMIPATIILIIGFFKPFGLSTWQFARTVLKEDVFSPRTYIYQSDFVYDQNEMQQEFDEPIHFPDEWSESETTVDYKLSKEDSFYFAK